MSEYDDYVSGRVDARYHNYMANKPGDEAEQNPVPKDTTRSHWCDFCQTFHSSQSCYHPGGNMLREAQNRIAELTLGIKSLTERCGDLEGDLERMLAQKIGEQKAKAKAEREVERLRKENRDLMLDWQKRQDKYEEELAKVRGSGAVGNPHIEHVPVDEHGEELVHALKRIASLESALERYRGKNAELLEKLEQAEASVTTWQNAYELADTEVKAMKAERIDIGIGLSEQLHDAVLERDELKLKNDVATDNISLYCDEIRELKAEVERLKAGQGLHIEYVSVDEHGEELVEALKTVERLTWMLREVYGDWVDGESYESWLADLARRWEER